MTSSPRAARRAVVRAIALLSVVFACVLSASLPGCGGGGGGSGSPSGFAVVYLRGGPTFTALDVNAAPVFAVRETWVDVVSVELVDTTGRRFAIGMNDNVNRPDLNARETSATLLAFGTFPEGEYTGAAIGVLAGAIHGVATGTALESDRGLNVGTGSFAAPFATPLTITAASASFVIDWAPSVTSNAAQTVFTLNDTAVLHRIGGSQAGDPATLPARDIAGFLVAQNCITGDLQIEINGAANLPVSTTASTDFLDHDAIGSSFVTCLDLEFDDVVLGKGVVQPSGAIIGSSVRVLRRASLPSSQTRTQFKGVIRDIAANGSVGVDMRISQGDFEVARVITDGSTGAVNGGTVIEGDDGTTIAFGALVEGMHVRVISRAVQPAFGGNPDISTVTDLVLVEQP